MLNSLVQSVLSFAPPKRAAKATSTSAETKRKVKGQVHLGSVEKSYGQGDHKTVVLKDLNLEVEPGEFVCLIGASGSGKSTVLKLVAGLTKATSGDVRVDDEFIVKPGPDRGMVFQQHVLLPWMNARKNVEFALKSARPELSSADRSSLACEYLESVQLGHAMERLPEQLSGGMQQRVGIARALALQPSVLLLDEPFGALDALTRASLQRLLLDVWERHRRTVLMVTHDVDEALTLADRVLVLGGSPSAVIDDIRVPFRRPRDPDAIRSYSEYPVLRQRIIASLLPDGPQPSV